MAFTQLTLGLTLTLPTNGTRSWGTTLRNTTWTKISQHAHTGSGDGNQITGSGIANGTINLTTKVTGILPIANGGTNSATQNFVDLTTAQVIAGSKTFSDDFILSFTDDAATGAVNALATTGKSGIRLTGAVTSLNGITNAADAKLVAVYNDSGSSINITNLSGSASSADQILTGTGGTVVLGAGQLALFLYNAADTKWLVVAGGGGASVEQSNLTGTTATVTSSSNQKFRYTGGSAQSLASITTTAIVENSVIEFLGTSDTNTFTLDPSTLTNTIMNGVMTLNRGSSIVFRWDSGLTSLVEVSRNGV